MPFALVVIGLIMVVTGTKNTHAEFGKLLTADFTGPNNFTFWVVSLGAVGSLGYSDTLRPFANSFMALIIIALVLRRGTGLFDQLKGALEQGPIAPERAEVPTADTKTADATDATGDKTGDVVKMAMNFIPFIL